MMTAFEIGETIRFQLRSTARIALPHVWNGTECVVTGSGTTGASFRTIRVRPIGDCPMLHAYGLAGNTNSVELYDYYFDKIELVDILGDDDEDCV